MSTITFNIQKLFADAWKDFKENAWFFLSVVAILFGAQIFMGALDRIEGAASGIAALINLLFGAIVGVSITRVMLQFVDGKGADFSRIVPPAQSVVWYVLYQLLLLCIMAVIFCVAAGLIIMSTAVSFGMLQGVTNAYDLVSLFGTGFVSFFGIGIAAVILMVYTSLRFVFAPYVIVDRDLSTLQAMRASSVLTQGIKMRLLGIAVVLGLFNLLGVFTFGLGLIITVPMSLIMFFRVYRMVSVHHAEKAVSHKDSVDKEDSEKEKKPVEKKEEGHEKKADDKVTPAKTEKKVEESTQKEERAEEDDKQETKEAK